MKYFIIGILILITSVKIYGQSEITLKKSRPYKSGESLRYTLKYGPFHGGDALVDLKLVKYEDKAAYHAIVLAKSVGITDKLYRIRDYYESYFDPKKIIPYKAIRNISEGNYKVYSEDYFNVEDSSIYSQKLDSVFKVPPSILDMVTLLYFIRSVDYKKMKVGDSLDIVTFFDNEIFPFPIRYRGKETIKTKMGKISCMIFVPVVEPGRIFESEDDMTFWLSDDKNLVPIRVKFDLIVGSVKCDLAEYTGLKYELKAVE